MTNQATDGLPSFSTPGFGKSKFRQHHTPVSLAFSSNVSAHTTATTGLKRSSSDLSPGSHQTEMAVLKKTKIQMTNTEKENRPECKSSHRTPDASTGSSLRAHDLNADHSWRSMEREEECRTSLQYDEQKTVNSAQLMTSSLMHSQILW